MSVRIESRFGFSEEGLREESDAEYENSEHGHGEDFSDREVVEVIQVRPRLRSQHDELVGLEGVDRAEDDAGAGEENVHRLSHEGSEEDRELTDEAVRARHRDARESHDHESDG